MNRDELIKIFEDTREICSNIPKPKSEKLTLGSANYSQLYPEHNNTIVENIDTVSALVKYAPFGKTAILNMASARNKGGGVVRGAMAQEECLFRCSNLYTIPDKFYPLSPNEYVYTHNASFVKDVYYRPMDIVKCDVITMPAINLNRYEYIESLILDKIEGIISSALSNDCKNIILGSWGCGVYKNDPYDISKKFKDALINKKMLFKNVIFAVVNDKNSVGNNYEIFKNTFNV